jgi:cytoskeletal protein RodZ
VARLNSVRITVIGLIIVVALALGAWTRLTIAMASGAAASRVSAGSPTTSALAMTNVAASKGTKPAKTDAKSTTSASTTKAASAAPTASSTATSSATTSSPQQIAQSMLSSYGWDSGQWTYLYQLWEKESGWSVTATNPGSGAYGIAQANPASQMDSVGSDWQTDATTQIKWGLEYIKDRYGSPAAAWAHETADGWY